MTDKHTLLAQTGMRFTSEMTTSATHELKNKLGIMNENAGLIQDFFYMEKQGRPLDTARIEAISHKIQDQVRLADTIIKKLNGFVLTMDPPPETPEKGENRVDLEQALKAVLALADRLIEKKMREIRVTPPKAPVMVAAPPFFLQNLLWMVIKAACSFEDGSGPVRILFDEKGDRPCIHFFVAGAKDPDWRSALELGIQGSSLEILAEMMNIEAGELKEENGFGLFWT